MKPAASLLWKRLIKIATQVKIDGVPISIPPVEGVLAAKLSAMVSPMRRLLDKQQDGLDFARIVTVNHPLNSALLEELGDLVYPGGGSEILRLVADAKAGKVLAF